MKLQVLGIGTYIRRGARRWKLALALAILVIIAAFSSVYVLRTRSANRRAEASVRAELTTSGVEEWRLKTNFLGQITDIGVDITANVPDIPIESLPALERLSFRGARLTKGDFFRARETKRLVVLQFHHCAGLTDDVLPWLCRNNPGLDVLVLWDCSNVTDEGMEGVGDLKHLRCLGLTGTRITDRAIATIGKARNEIETFWLHGTAVTSAAGDSLARLRRLRILEMSDTRFGDEGVRSIASLERLARLLLDGTPITDVALQYIAGMKTIGYLDVTGTQITDSGLAALHECMSLRRVIVDRTRVTRAGAIALKRANPGCEVQGP